MAVSPLSDRLALGDHYWPSTLCSTKTTPAHYLITMQSTGTLIACLAFLPGEKLKAGWVKETDVEKLLSAQKPKPVVP